MSKYRIIIIVVFIFFCICFIGIFVLNSNDKHIPLLEVTQVSKEFKSNVGNRDAQAKILMPYLKVGMSKENVESLLGESDYKTGSGKYFHYSLGRSNVLSVYFDEQEKMFHVEGPGIKFASHYDRVWPFLRAGMTKESVSIKMYEPSIISDNGMKWQYKDDTYLYWITFDDNDKVINLEKTKRETEHDPDKK